MKRFMTIFKLFALASTLTFSGGLATVPMLHEEIVIKRNEMSSESFYHYVSLGQTMPGVQVVSVACLLGYKINGRWGRYAASLGAIAPVLAIMTALTAAYRLLPQTGIIVYVMSAFRATAGVYILEAVLGMYPYVTNGKKKLKFIVPLVAVMLAFLPISSVLILIVYGVLAVISVWLGKDLL